MHMLTSLYHLDKKKHFTAFFSYRTIKNTDDFLTFYYRLTYAQYLPKQRAIITYNNKVYPIFKN
jgi:hypothetical protein